MSDQQATGALWDAIRDVIKFFPATAPEDGPSRDAGRLDKIQISVDAGSGTITVRARYGTDIGARKEFVLHQQAERLLADHAQGWSQREVPEGFLVDYLFDIWETLEGVWDWTSPEFETNAADPVA